MQDPTPTVGAPTDSATDPGRCPLCGQPNACAMASPGPCTSQAPCWCTTAHFAPELLARVPAPARRKACICAACARPPASSTSP